MFFSLNKIDDLNKPFYLFTHDLKYKSKPIFVSNEIYKKSDDEICSICLENFENINSQDVLSCGHTFHNECLLKCLNKTECYNCKETKYNTYESYGLKMPISEHYFKLICPFCRQKSI